MKDEYILYLDESEFNKSKTFAIAGIAIKKENIIILEQGVEEIKKSFGKKIIFLLIILFCIVLNYRRFFLTESQTQ